MPVPSVIVSTESNQTVGQSLTLQCNITTVRGITSRVDIVWSSNNTELSITKGVNISSETDDSVIFTDAYIITQLSTIDESRGYHCEAVIDTELPVKATDSIVLNVTGMYYS